jgi:hypothetical protein
MLNLTAFATGAHAGINKYGSHKETYSIRIRCEKIIFEKVKGAGMKHLRSMRKMVNTPLIRALRPGTRWLLGIVFIGSCCFFVKQELASATKTVGVQKKSHKVERFARTEQQPESSVVSGQPRAELSETKKIASAQQVPPTFGKSHFIVGMPADEVARRCAVASPAKDDVAVNAYDMVCLGVFPQALFSPHDEVCKTLVHLIENEKKSIKVAAYAMTEPQVAKALSAAIKRGVAISLIVDRSCLDMASNKIKLLRKTGVDVAIFDGKTREDGALMHNKFYLFEENIKNRRLLWTGSANTTKSGYVRNHENVMIVDEPVIFARYVKEFDLLLTIADRLKS